MDPTIKEDNNSINKEEKLEKQEKIKILIELEPEELKCCICFAYLYEIYRCVNGLHLTCKICQSKINTCQVCKSDKDLLRDNYLEKNIQPFLMNCQNEKCSKKIFMWDNEHAKECLYRQVKCVFCNDDISSFTEHLEHDCSIKFDSRKIDTLIRQNYVTIPTLPCFIKTEEYIILFNYNENKTLFYTILLTDNINKVGEKFYLKLGNKDEFIVITIFTQHTKNFKINKIHPVYFLQNNSAYKFSKSQFY